MEENFVTFDIAVKLREKGFTEKCLAAYIIEDYWEYNRDLPISNRETFFSHNSHNNMWHKDCYDAPTIPQVLKWLRNEKKIFINVDVRTSLEWYYEVWNINEKLSVLGNVPFNKSESYEEAAIAGVEYVLDNLI